MKIRAKDLSDKSRIETLDALYTASGTVKGRSAMKRFLRDLLTESERIMLGRRILIARYLLEDRSYRDICEALGVGSDTVGRVHRWLEDQIPGYETVIRDMEREMSLRKPRSRSKEGIDGELYAKSALYRLKKKYPLHFLLFPWPKG